MIARGARNRKMSEDQQVTRLVAYSHWMRRSGRAAAVLSAIAALVALGLASAPAAGAAYGDLFGIAPVNDGGGPLEDSPVFDGTRAFWAGTCGRAEAPAPGVDLAALGGIGTLPETVPAPTGASVGQPQIAQVEAPVTPEHCVDWGALPEQQSVDSWSVPPAWRLPAETVAGAHADGTLTMWMRKGGDVGTPFQPDGNVDNVYVDLPPGFVGDPNAVPKCTAEQFAVRPLLCPPETQVGVLRLHLVGPGGLTGSNYIEGSASEEIVPVYNLEPRKGNVAELGMGYLASNTNPNGRGFVTARIVAKARTNGDFGVTSFIGQIPTALPLISQAITLWGVPWDPANDVWRAPLGLADGGGSNSDGDPVPYHPCAEQPGAGHPDTLPYSGLSEECKESYDPSWGEIKPFVSLETDCNQSPLTRLSIDSFQRPGSFTGEGYPAVPAFPAVPDEDLNWPGSGWKTYGSASPAVTGCESLDFEPDISFDPGTSAADGPAGLHADLQIPQKTAPPFPKPDADAPAGDVEDYVDDATAYWKSEDGRAVAHLKDTVVTMPAGVSLNPSAATGLVACPDSVVGVREQGNPPLFNNADPADGIGGDDCPDGSKIGTARVETPLLDEPLTGDVILGEPKSTDPQSGEMLRTFLVLRNKARGLVAKIYGTAKADPATGQITATFANNPELPFDRLELDFKGGDKGLLAMPKSCGAPAWAAAFTPWSSVGAATPVPDSPDGGAFAVDANCTFGFAPGLDAGMDIRRARAHGTLSFEMTRPEGQQWINGLTAKLPKGLLASVKGVPLCTDSQAAAGACPAGSKIGIADASAGSGDPFVLEEKGEVFLTEGYKGGAYGLLVKVRGIAGPFRGSQELSPILVRQALHVDRTTAEVTAISDPFPTVHHGIPLRVRRIAVLVNRPSFMLNPSNCSAKQIDAAIGSAEGAVANRSRPFTASACRDLPFKPKLAIRLTGPKQVKTGKHPGVRARVSQAGVGEAGIERAEVRLPKSLALDPDNAQALCDFEDGTSANPEGRCPSGSIVGRAQAVSPLLNRPLVGNVYFVKNVRRSSTGNLIRTLPMLIVALRGEIAINLKGESNVKRGKLVNTFANVPDAPISRFDLNIKGGKNGIVAVTRTRRAKIDLCRSGRQIAEADMDGHNGRVHDRDVVLRKPCRKRSKAVPKRKASAERTARDRR